MTKTQYLSIVVVVLIIIGGTIFYRTATVIAPGDAGSTPTPTNSANPIVSVLNGKVTIAGNIACLPKINTGQPQTEECAIGLKSKDGKFYALTDINTDDFVSGKISGGMNVTITGELSSTKNEVYDIIGTIKVTSYK